MSDERSVRVDDASEASDSADRPAREAMEREAALARGLRRATGRPPATPEEAADARRDDARVATHARALREGAAVFRALADAVRDYAIFLLDLDGVITYWGEGAHLMKWWSKEQAEGAHLRLLYPNGGSEDGTAEAHLLEAAEKGEYTGEGQRIRVDGSTFWAGVTLTALRDGDGKLIGFAKVTRDLTTRRAADAVLLAAGEAAERARGAAQAANAAKSGFLATMSHEIRTPLNAILGYHDLLEMEVGGPITPAQREYLTRARASGRHLLGLINDVLDLSRLEANRVSVRRSARRLGDVVRESIALVEPLADARGIPITIALSARREGTAYWGDEERVRQVIVNLLSNALKFTARGGRVVVSVGAAAEPPPSAAISGSGPWAYVRVEDTGEGIPPDRLAAVFEPFVQVDMSHTRQHGGSGLGLSIARRLARLMGGDLTARSEVGVGSTFLLWLPAAPAGSLRTSGVEGHSPNGGRAGGDLLGDEPTEERAQQLVETRERTLDASRVGALREAADAVLGDMERILHAYVARLRTDPATPSAHRTEAAEIEDHLATFLADVAQSLAAIDISTGAPTERVQDGSMIQRVIADRHGQQRARLGWARGELEREYDVLGEELAAAVQRQWDQGPNVEARRAEARRALVALDQFVEVARRTALASFTQHTNGGAGGTPGAGAA